jgi:hypothetical protein
VLATVQPRYALVDVLTSFRGTPLEPFAALLIHKEADRLKRHIDATPRLKQDAHVTTFERHIEMLRSRAPDLYRAILWADNDPTKWALVQATYLREGRSLEAYDLPRDCAKALASLPVRL